MRTRIKKEGSALSKRSVKIKTNYRKNIYGYSQVPELRITGKWLEKLGFEAESRVSIESANGLLIIRPEG